MSIRVTAVSSFQKSAFQAVLTALALSLPLAVKGAEAGEGKAVVLDTLTVNAQKLAENPQDVGISLAVLGGSDVELLGLTSPSQIPNHVAGLTLAQPNGTGAFSYSIRGVTQNDFADHQESPTAIYVDEAYVSQMAGLAFQLFDVDRVEVLRGPQGTLFGRNATGGLVQYFSRKPTEKTEGYLKLTAGNDNRIGTEGAVGGSVAGSDTLSARVSFATSRRDDLFHNPNGGAGAENGNEQAARAQLRIKFADQADLLLSARGGRQDVRAGAWESVVSSPGADGYGVFSSGTNAFGLGNSGDFTYLGNVKGYAKIDTTGLSARLQAPVEALGAKLTALLDFQHLNKRYLEDSDTTAEDAFEFFNTSKVSQYSSELRLNGESQGLKWITGLYALDIDGKYTEGALGSVYGGLYDPYSLKTRSYAVFGQVEYPISTDLSLTTGARYTKDRKDIDYHSSYPGFAFDFGPGSVGSLSRLDDGFWTGRVSLDYRLSPSSLAYLSYNLGVKAGGFNAPLDPGVSPDPHTIPFKRETLNAYEAGIKSEFLEHRLRVNTSVFYYDYKDNQALHFINLTQLISNAAARHVGGEVEVQYALSRTWLAGGGLGYTDAVVKDIDLNGLGPRDYTPANAPRLTGNAFLRYSEKLGTGFLSLQADGNYVSGQYFALTNAGDTYQGGYVLTNLRGSYVTSGGHWEYSAGVENVLDKHYAVMGFDLAGFLGLAQRYPGKPRSFSASVSYRF